MFFFGDFIEPARDADALAEPRAVAAQPERYLALQMGAATRGRVSDQIPVLPICMVEHAIIKSICQIRSIETVSIVV